MHRVERDDGRVGFATAWTEAHSGCGCGRPRCAGCALTLRTIFVVQSELAWIADLAEEDLIAVRLGRRPIADTVLAGLPASALRWALAHPLWLRRFREAVGGYVARISRPGPLEPRCVAEEMALRMAFDALRTEIDPDDLLPPDMAASLPALPGDYAWSRAVRQMPWSENVGRSLEDNGADDSLVSALHPESWFEPF